MNFSLQDIVSKPVPERYDMLIKQTSETFLINSTIKDNLNVTFINPLDLFCNTEGCKIFDENNKMIIYDGFHLTPAGARYFANKFPLKIFNNN